jgi:hypothetical protein
MTTTIKVANRHERRRQAVILEKRRISPAQIGGCHCGWKGCDAVFKASHSGEFVLPPGWSWLIVHDTPKPPMSLVDGLPGLSLARLKWRHDKALCPEHTRTLDDLLLWRDGEFEELETPAGRA